GILSVDLSPMAEKKSVFHRLKLLYTVNPRMVWAMGWVTLVPSLGALISLNFLYANPGFFEIIEFLSWPFLGVYVVIAILVLAMGCVSFVPWLCAFISLDFLYAQPGVFEKIEFLSWPFLRVYVVTASLVKGLALLPTTFLAILSGFVLGWMSIPFLQLGYT